MPTPPTGFIPQYYRGAAGYNFDELQRRMDAWQQAGCSGVAVHGFTSELNPDAFDKHAKAAAARQLKCYAAFGLDSDNPETKGKRVAAVANHPLCAGVLFDMEGAWENEADDKQKATAMGHAFRELAPANAVWACDQPWPVPTVHWSSFPWEEIADFVDARAPQYYYNDWKRQWGRARYAKCEKLFNDAWAKLTERLKRTHHDDPVIVTLQGYGWDDIRPDLVAALLGHSTAFLWSEPWLSDTVLWGLRVVQELAKRGFTGPGAVLAFQQKYNETAANPIAADGRCGPITAGLLGVA